MKSVRSSEKPLLMREGPVAELEIEGAHKKFRRAQIGPSTQTGPSNTDADARCGRRASCRAAHPRARSHRQCVDTTASSTPPCFHHGRSTGSEAACAHLRRTARV